jgi:predicted acyl esterase
MSTVRPRPALKVAVPFAPMVDGWMGDDWFHNGAFRQDGALQYVYYDQEATRRNELTWWTDARATYEVFLRAGSAGALANLARGGQRELDRVSSSGRHGAVAPAATAATGR